MVTESPDDWHIHIVVTENHIQGKWESYFPFPQKHYASTIREVFFKKISSVGKRKAEMEKEKQHNTEII